VYASIMPIFLSAVSGFSVLIKQAQVAQQHNPQAMHWFTTDKTALVGRGLGYDALNNEKKNQGLTNFKITASNINNSSKNLICSKK